MTAPTNQYGSINVRSEEAEEDSDDLSVSASTSAKARKYTLSTTIGALALVFALFVAIASNNSGNRHPSSATSTQNKVSVSHNVEVLAKVHRTPADTPHAFSQLVDHLDDSNYDTWQQRYYKKSEYFRGPGHPIFLVVGGEGALDSGMFYPFVDTYLAEKFGAYVLHAEHRFYGQSQPVDPLLVTNRDLSKFHTARQSMLDHVAIVQSYQRQLGCSPHKTSKDYCPVISVGGSYPGFLSAVMRLHYPDVIDIGYASSAPLLLYAMEASQYGYMDHVTNVTDKASPGCAEAVRQTLQDVDEAIRATSNDVDSDNYFKDFAYQHLNMCPGTIPNYITSKDLLSEEAMMIVEYTFADWNMDYYPPNEDTGLFWICQHVFQHEKKTSFEKMAEFWYHLEDNIDVDMPCFDMSSQLPDGPKATISGSDWSGVGPGYDGYMFDFHCCSTLTPLLGFSSHSMFPKRKWTLEWLTDHCVSRFNVVPEPRKLVDEFKFDDLVGQGATKILFTDGMNDMWSQAASALFSNGQDFRIWES